MLLYNEAIIMADTRQDLCSLEDNVITEKYNWKKNYTGKYTTNGIVCNCSWFASKFICRHILFFRMQTEQPIFEENMFHPSLKSNTNTIEIEDDNPGNESMDMFSSFVAAPASPGMESLIQEQNEAAKLIPKNVRFNRAYDVCKVVAEDLSKYNSEQFLDMLEMAKSFSTIIRDGVPKKLRE